MLSSKQSPESIYMALSMLDVAFPPIAVNAIFTITEMYLYGIVHVGCSVIYLFIFTGIFFYRVKYELTEF